MLGTVVVAFFVCLLPFRALTLWIILIAPENFIMDMGIELYYNLLYFCRIMIYLNSAINPILYNIMSSKFRNGFLKLCGVKVKRKKRFSYSSSRKNASNTTSSTNNGSHNNDSFWSRYSNRKNSNRESIDNNSVRNNNRNAKEIYVKIPVNLNIAKGESYV